MTKPNSSPSPAQPTLPQILATALEIAVEDISEMDKGARYTTASYIAAAKRRLTENPHE